MEHLLLVGLMLRMIEVVRSKLVGIARRKVSSDVQGSRRSILVIAELSSVKTNFRACGRSFKLLRPVLTVHSNISISRSLKKSKLLS